MRSALFLTATILAVASAAIPLFAHAHKPLAFEASQEVIRAETEFDAFTHDHGYTKGFFTYSAPNAVAFDNSGTVLIHEKLAVRLTEDNSEKDAPSKLRWRAYRVLVNSTGDMACDIGPWTNESTGKAGWFLTIWEKQPDGKWLWLLDTGAGQDTAEKLPALSEKTIHFIEGRKRPLSAALKRVVDKNITLDSKLQIGSAAVAYASLPPAPKVVMDDSNPPATDKDAVTAALAARPAGLRWQMDGQGISSDGTFAYTYGHATSVDGVYRGHYVRVWTNSSLDGPDFWLLDSDLYQSAK